MFPNFAASKFGEDSGQPRQQIQQQQQQRSFHREIQSGRLDAEEAPEIKGPNAVEKQELDEAVRSMRHFKEVQFEITRLSRRATVHMLFAMCTPENMMEPSGTFYLTLNDKVPEGAGFMVKDTDYPPVHKQMKQFVDFVQTANGHDEEKGMLPKDNKHVIVQTVEVEDVIHDLPRNRPIALTIDGVSKNFTQSHRFNYNDKAASGVIVMGAAKKTMYASRSAPSMLEGFHGTVDCVNNKGDFSSWGRLRNGMYQVPLISEKAIFLFYNLYELLCRYKHKKSTLPKGLSQEAFDEIEKCHKDFNDSGKDNGVFTSLYGLHTDLTDGYIGYIIDILNNHAAAGEPWTHAPTDLHFNVPEDAIKFFAETYESHIDGIVLTAPEKIKVSASYMNAGDAEIKIDGQEHKNAKVFFTVKAKVFVPRMFFWIAEAQDSNQN
jgi:hypothetical protein